jgi:serine/threonine protein kinase
MDRMTTAPVQMGEVLRHKYRLEQVLGQGGMGIVVAAWHLVLDQRVAIKLLRPEVRGHPEVIARFLREARAASRLEGPHAVRLLDVDTLEDGTPFMVMEHLDGADLSSVRRSGRPLSPGEVAAHLVDVCEAIAEAHALGIVHRDLKPANLFLARRRDGRIAVKVLDFGISKLPNAAASLDSALTKENTSMGSPEYMAPEQMLSARDVDARADLWSLGVILYELCTAKSPFTGASFADVCARVLTGSPAPPRSLRPDLPPGLEAIILRCLEKDPARRFASADELRAALLPFAVRPPVEPPPADRTSQPTGAPAVPPPPSSLPGPRSAASRSPLFSRLVVAGVAVACMAVVLIAFALGRSQGGPEGEGSSREPLGRYQAAEGTVLDTKTQLRWERSASSIEMSHTAADGRCASLRSDSNPWRLPTQAELAILAEGLRKSAGDRPVFHGVSTGYLWSSSPVVGAPRQVWIVRLPDGHTTSASVSSAARVRCVR